MAQNGSGQERERGGRTSRGLLVSFSSTLQEGSAEHRASNIHLVLHASGVQSIMKYQMITKWIKISLVTSLYWPSSSWDVLYY